MNLLNITLFCLSFVARCQSTLLLLLLLVPVAFASLFVQRWRHSGR